MWTVWTCSQLTGRRSSQLLYGDDAMTFRMETIYSTLIMRTSVKCAYYMYSYDTDNMKWSCSTVQYCTHFAARCFFTRLPCCKGLSMSMLAALRSAAESRTSFESLRSLPFVLSTSLAVVAKPLLATVNR